MAGLSAASACYIVGQSRLLRQVQRGGVFAHGAGRDLGQDRTSQGRRDPSPIGAMAGGAKRRKQRRRVDRSRGGCGRGSRRSRGGGAAVVVVVALSRSGGRPRSSSSGPRCGGRRGRGGQSDRGWCVSRSSDRGRRNPRRRDPRNGRKPCSPVRRRSPSSARLRAWKDFPSDWARPGEATAGRAYPQAGESNNRRPTRTTPSEDDVVSSSTGFTSKIGSVLSEPAN